MDEHPKELSDMKRHDLPSAAEWKLASRGDLVALIERLERDKAELVHQHNQLMKAVQAEQDRAEKAERELLDCEQALEQERAAARMFKRERDEARAIIERWRGLLNEAANALGREHEGLVGEICVALGGEG